MANQPKIRVFNHETGKYKLLTADAIKQLRDSRSFDKMEIVEEGSRLAASADKAFATPVGKGNPVKASGSGKKDEPKDKGKKDGLNINLEKIEVSGDPLYDTEGNLLEGKTDEDETGDDDLK